MVESFAAMMRGRVSPVTIDDVLARDSWPMSTVA